MSRGWIVSVEVLDDVAAVGPDGETIAEQDKSTYDGNPVSDRALELWKTLSNWVDSVASGSLDVTKTEFVLYISIQKSGTIVNNLDAAKTIEDAKKAILEAKQELWGLGPTYTKKAEVADTIRPFVDNFLNADVEITSKIILNFNLIFGIGDSESELLLMMGTYTTVPPDIALVVLAGGAGWVHLQVMKKLDARTPATINVDAFKDHLHHLARKHDVSTILRTYAPDLPQSIIGEHLQVKPYIRQLELIDCDDGYKLNAISNYFKASYDRTEWTDRGEMDEETIEDFEQELIYHWSNIRLQSYSITGSPIVVGRWIYGKCGQFRSDLGGLRPPPHFIPGSFHMLSNEMMVGWHPDYKNSMIVQECEVPDGNS